MIMSLRGCMLDIDFVIPWVDPSDPNWQLEFAKYYKGSDDVDARIERYRDWQLLRYWFRGVELYAPWVRKIHFVTFGHVPDWLNVSHPKINIIKHEDYISEDYLPVFSANPIELLMNNIKGLSEHFVYFNDDLFLINKMLPEDFFVDGLPCDIAVSNALSPTGISSIILNDLTVISKHFNKRDVILNNFTRWFSPRYKEKLLRTLLLLPWPSFTGFFDPHMPQPFLKSVLDEVWDKESEVLINSCHSRFRSTNDVNQYLFRYWQLCSGKFSPSSCSNGKYFNITNENVMEICSVVLCEKTKIIVINDSDEVDFENAFDLLKYTFESKFKFKSEFELDRDGL